MTYDYSKLNGRIVEVFGNRYTFAKAMGWSNNNLSLKLNNKGSWQQKDIVKAVDLLSVDKNEIGDYFFALKVQ